MDGTEGGRRPYALEQQLCIIESEWQLLESHQDHIADEVYTSLYQYWLAHNPSAKTKSDGGHSSSKKVRDPKEWDKLKHQSSRDESTVRNKADVTRESSTLKVSSTICNFDGFCHLKHSKVACSVMTMLPKPAEQTFSIHYSVYQKWLEKRTMQFRPTHKSN